VIVDDRHATVHAIGVGIATVTASLGDQAGSSQVTVTAAELTSIDITPKNASIAKGTSQQLAATALFSDNTTLDVTNQASWESSSPSVAAPKTFKRDFAAPEGA
jgi:hypothetical protein